MRIVKLCRFWALAIGTSALLLSGIVQAYDPDDRISPSRPGIFPGDSVKSQMAFSIEEPRVRRGSSLVEPVLSAMPQGSADADPYSRLGSSSAIPLRCHARRSRRADIAREWRVSPTSPSDGVPSGRGGLRFCPGRNSILTMISKRGGSHPNKTCAGRGSTIGSEDRSDTCGVATSRWVTFSRSSGKEFQDPSKSQGGSHWRARALRRGPICRRSGPWAPAGSSGASATRSRRMFPTENRTSLMRANQ